MLYEHAARLGQCSGITPEARWAQDSYLRAPRRIRGSSDVLKQVRCTSGLMRRQMVAGFALLTVAVGVGLRGMETGHAAPDSSTSSKLVTSPCGALRLPTWSPDGKQIAAAGHDAICVMDAEGRHAEQLPSTDVLADSSITQLVWVRPSFLLSNDNFRFFIVPVGAKPLRQIPHVGGESFSVSVAGNRFAVGVDVAQFAIPGPVKVLRLPFGPIVGRVGGRRLNNTAPSLSPNGMQVAFVRNTGDALGHCCRTLGIWTAWTDGSHLRQLAPSGSRPLWSPAGGKIAYLAEDGLRVVSLHGGRSRVLVSQGVGNVPAWSPNGKRIAFGDPEGRLAVVQVATGKVRELLNAGWPDSVSWSPNSQQLLVSTHVKARDCYAIWRVPAGSGKPELLRRC